MPWPEAEIVVDEDLVRRLLERQHPDLSDLSLELVDAGFDNFIFRLGADRAIRIPRREPAATLIEHEQRWLPLLPELPLEVPVPERLGQPGEGYPWHWSVVPWIEGEPTDRRPPAEQGLTAVALGGFLNELHRTPPDGLPANPFRSGPLTTRRDAFEDRLKRLEGHIDERQVRDLWAEALHTPEHTGPPLWLHGDLHPANLLAREGTVAAVIDFGDTCAGDPACDLGAAYLTVAPEHRAALHAAYQDGRTVSAIETMKGRAEGWTLLFALMLLEIGLAQRPTYAAVARRALGWAGAIPASPS